MLPAPGEGPLRLVEVATPIHRSAQASCDTDHSISERHHPIHHCATWEWAEDDPSSIVEPAEGLGFLPSTTLA